MIFYKRRGQSLLEYSILFAVILSAILIMQFFIKRGYQGRLKKDTDTVGQGNLYSPGHTTSIITTTTNSTSVGNTEDGIQSTAIEADSAMDKRETIDSFATE